MSKISKKLDEEIRLEAKNRCGYCLGEQKYILAWLEIEHLHPRAKGGKTVKENLWLACTYCNTFKSSSCAKHLLQPEIVKIRMFNKIKLLKLFFLIRNIGYLHFYINRICNIIK